MDIEIYVLDTQETVPALDFGHEEEYLAFWIKNVSPTMKLWHNLIMERIPNEYMTRMRHSSMLLSVKSGTLTWYILELHCYLPYYRVT